jgi:hypothetical protein
LEKRSADLKSDNIEAVPWEEAKASILGTAKRKSK